MFYGWGTKSKDWTMSDGRQLVLRYRFFSIMFIFQIAFAKKWMLIGRDRAMDQTVDRNELQRLYGNDVPNLGLWSQWGLVLSIVALMTFAIVSSLFA